jgi:ADP-dependent NAD(P)H-hydrate dehydratase / NAD(P)H-hydrate epimerase
MWLETLNEPRLWRAKLPELSSSGNKYSRGHAFIMGGYPMTGAARLAARACARIGAGLVSIGVPEMAMPIYAGALLSIMVQPLATVQDFNLLLEDDRISALLIGSGLKPSVDVRAQTLSMLATLKPVVIDAGALMAFGGHQAFLWTALHRAANSAQLLCVLTPHEGEFAQLFGHQIDLAQRRSRAREAAQISGAIVLLKGAETLIAHPNGQLIISRHAPPSLATAGSGDVLSGILVGLLAQGMPPFEAAAAAVWLHGCAATLFGTGLIADDLPDLLPQALKALQA